jgi:multiple sugar transport system permease protein
VTARARPLQTTRRRVLRPGRLAWTAASYALLSLMAFFFLFPIVFMVVSSLKGDELQLISDMPSARAFVPYGSVGAQNYRDVFDRVPFLRAAFNSGLVVATTVALGLAVNSAFAYALARMRFPGRDALLGAVVALIIIPFQTVAIPLLLLVNRLPWFGGARGWLDSYHVQIIPFVAHAFSIYLFYQFFISLPRELEEAALVDGASRLRIYTRIVLPLSGPVFATVAVLQFLARWGDLLWPVMVVRGDRFATLPLMMQSFFGQQPWQWGDIMAFATMTSLPTLALFLAFQRWFVQSVAASGVKG